MITILLPIYNGIEFIDECVSSIHFQTYKDWELIIGINGHPKESEIYKIAKEYEEKDSRIKVLDLYEIKGKSNALNEMIKYCQYDWISLIDVDDNWLFNKLEWWHTIYYKRLNDYFTHKYLVKDDQMVIIDCIINNLKNFKLIEEPDLRKDRWFVFQSFLI